MINILEDKNNSMDREKCMKIAIDLTSLADNFPGIERYALNIARELIGLDKENRHTYILLLFKNQIHPEFETYLDKDIVDYKVYKSKNKLFFTQVLLAHYLYKQKQISICF